MMFGERTDTATASRIARAAFEAGVNFIDTADAYGDGESERIVGKIIAKNRNRWVVATKFASRTIANDPNSGGTGRKWMMHAVAQSLKRLGTDYIDIYYFHRDDAKTPLEESLAAMGELIRAGKVRYFGLSNIAGWRISEVVAQCRLLDVPWPIVLQPYYNALYRLAEVEQLPACQYHGLGVVPYSPLARGVLTGKYAPGRRPPADSRGGRGEPRFLETEMRKDSLIIAQTLKRHAEKKGMSAAQFALNWVLNNALVTSVLAGPRTFEQWREYIAALGHGFGADDEALVDQLVARGHCSTPGYTDPKYPVTGRVPLR
jgi:aryl-alcohol dehydrogenase (NADP+)